MISRLSLRFSAEDDIVAFDEFLSSAYSFDLYSESVIYRRRQSCTYYFDIYASSPQCKAEASTHGSH